MRTVRYNYKNYYIKGVYSSNPSSNILKLLFTIYNDKSNMHRMSYILVIIYLCIVINCSFV